MPDFITAKAAKTVWHTDLGLYLAAPQYIFWHMPRNIRLRWKKRLSTVAVHLNLGFHAAILLSFYKLFWDVKRIFGSVGTRQTLPLTRQSPIIANTHTRQLIGASNESLNMKAFYG